MNRFTCIDAAALDTATAYRLMCGVVVPRPELAPCDTGKACEVGACIAAACKAIDVKNAADCDDGNPCTNDVCDDAKGGCVHPPTPFAVCTGTVYLRRLVSTPSFLASGWLA